jgi:predicted transcriptional regulator
MDEHPFIWSRVEYISRSKNRVQILQYLLEHKNSDNITDDLDIPRSTIIRTLGELSEYGWISGLNSGSYQITQGGKL